MNVGLNFSKACGFLLMKDFPQEVRQTAYIGIDQIANGALTGQAIHTIIGPWPNAARLGIEKTGKNAVKDADQY